MSWVLGDSGTRMLATSGFGTNLEPPTLSLSRELTSVSQECVRAFVCVYVCAHASQGPVCLLLNIKQQWVS